MSVLDNYLPVRLQGNGTTTVFTANWPVINADFVYVYLEYVDSGNRTLQVQGTNYTIQVSQNEVIITFVIPPPDNQYVVIGRSIEKDQQVPYTTSDGFDGITEETSFDKLTLITQDLQHQINKSLSFLPFSVYDGELPAPSDGSILAWDGDNGNIKNTSLQDFTNAAIGALDQLVLTFNVATMKSNDHPIGQSVRTSEYTAGTGKGGAIYLIVGSAGYTGAVDTNGDHTLTNGSIAVLQTDAPIPIENFGAVGNDATADSAAMQAAAVRGEDILLSGNNVTYINGTVTTFTGTMYFVNGARINATSTLYIRKRPDAQPYQYIFEGDVNLEAGQPTWFNVYADWFGSSSLPDGSNAIEKSITFSNVIYMASDFNINSTVTIPGGRQLLLQGFNSVGTPVASVAASITGFQLFTTGSNPITDLVVRDIDFSEISESLTSHCIKFEGYSSSSRSSLIIKDCSFRGFYEDIRTKNVKGCFFRNNKFFKNMRNFYIQRFSSDIYISNFVTYDVGNFFLTDSDLDPYVDFSEEDFGITIMDGHIKYLTDQTIVPSGAMVSCSGWVNFTLKDCTFTGSLLNQRDMVVIEKCNDVEIINCNFSATNSNSGVWIVGSKDVSVLDCKIARCNTGVEVYGCERITIHGNDFLNNSSEDIKFTETTQTIATNNTHRTLILGATIFGINTDHHIISNNVFTSGTVLFPVGSNVEINGNLYV